MGTIALAGYTAAAATVLTTELNALATATASAAGPAQDNTVNLDVYADFELAVTYAGAPTAGSTVDLYLIPSLDGTNYGDSAVLPVTYWVGSFILRAVTTAQRVEVSRVPLSPNKWKAAVINNAGTAMPATGTTVSVRTYKLTD